MSEKPKSVVVIGGGLAGASAAYALTKCGYAVTIIERENRLGGRIHSHVIDGAAVEMGAGFLTRGYKNLLDFMTATGLNRQLYRQHGSTGIFKDRQVFMLDAGVVFGNRPLTWGAKLHAIPVLFKTLASWPQLDLHAFWKADKFDTRSIADLFSSASGKEFLENVVQPVLNGYFYWTPEHTSESMLRILCKAAFTHGTYKMRGGLQRIPEKAAEGSEILLNHIVKSVRQVTATTYDITIEHHGREQILHPDGVICATTASAVPGIFSDLTKEQRKFFQDIQYSSAALIARTYKQEETCGDKAIAFPRKEGVELSAVTLSPEPESGDATYATIKTYASGVAAAELAALPDQELGERLVAAMEPVRSSVLIGDPKPVATHIQRWPEALPFFDVGHFKRLREFEHGGIEDPNHAITFAGDYIGGPFMEGAYTSGVRAADRLHARLSK